MRSRTREDWPTVAAISSLMFGTVKGVHTKMSFNSITILGNLTRDPESGALPDGTETSRFGIAVNSKKSGEDVPTYFRANVIGKVAGVANQYLAKGRQVLIVGELRQDNFTKSDGTPGSSLEVKVTSLQLVGGKPEESAEPKASAATATGGGKSKAKSKPLPEPDDDSDVPF